MLPVEAIRLAVDVERTCREANPGSDPIFIVSGQRLYVRPSTALSVEQRDGIKRYRLHLMALAQYEAPRAA